MTQFTGGGMRFNGEGVTLVVIRVTLSLPSIWLWTDACLFLA